MAKDDQGRDLQKHTLLLFQGDYKELERLFPKVAPAKVIRHLVRNLIDRTKGDAPNVDITVEVD